MGFKQIAADFKAAKQKFGQGFFFASYETIGVPLIFVELERDDLNIEVTFAVPDKGINEEYTIVISEDYPLGEHILLGIKHIPLRGTFDNIFPRACFGK